MKKTLFLLLMAAVTLVGLYLSRFWFLTLWDRNGLFGIEALRPTGGLLGRWLRGTDAAPFELLIWVVAVFFILTWLQKLGNLFTSK